MHVCVIDVYHCTLLLGTGFPMELVSMSWQYADTKFYCHVSPVSG